MRITSSVYRSKVAVQNSANSNNRAINLSYGTQSSKQLMTDTVSFARKPILAPINEEAMNYVKALAQSNLVGKKFHSDFLEPVTKLLAANGLKIVTTKKDGEHLARLVVDNSLLHRKAVSKYNEQVRIIKNGLPAHSKTGLTSHNYPESEFLFDKFVKSTANMPYRGVNENHAKALLISRMHNEKLLLLKDETLSPNRVLAQKLPTISDLNDSLNFHLKKIFPQSITDFDAYKKYAVGLLFPSKAAASSSKAATSINISTSAKTAVSA